MFLDSLCRSLSSEFSKICVFKEPVSMGNKKLEELMATFAIEINMDPAPELIWIN